MTITFRDQQSVVMAFPQVPDLSWFTYLQENQRKLAFRSGKEFFVFPSNQSYVQKFEGSQATLFYGWEPASVELVVTRFGGDRARS